MPSPELMTLALGLILLASLIGSLWSYLRRLWAPARAEPSDAPPAPSAPPKPKGPPIFVDGSNVMYWGGDGATLHALIAVLDALKAKGYAPVIWFDANVGFKLMGQHMDRFDLAPMLSVPVDAVHLAPSGQPADPLVIAAALDAKARLVSNDRFMDWRAQFPGLRTKGVLVKGKVKGAKVEMTL